MDKELKSYLNTIKQLVIGGGFSLVFGYGYYNLLLTLGYSFNYSLLASFFISGMVGYLICSLFDKKKK